MKQIQLSQCKVTFVYNRIYRVEHRTSGWGPYNWDNPVLSQDDIAKNLSNEMDMKHTSRLDLYPTMRKVGYRCGFASMKKLNRWFREWRTRLRDCNYIIRVYESAHVEHCPSGRQLLFFFDYARLLRTVEIR